MNLPKLLALVLAFLTSAAGAQKITFDFSGIADFTVSGVFYPSASFDVQLQADIANRKSYDWPGLVYYYEGLAPGTITISGVGSGTFLNSMAVFSNQGTSGAGFRPDPGIDLLNLDDDVFRTYDLKSSIVVVGGRPMNYGQWEGILTTLGTTTLGNITSTTFSASVATVPEPSQTLLFTAGLSTLLIARRRRSSQGN